MKRTFYAPAVVFLLLAGFFTVTSCGNSAKKAQDNTADSAAQVQAFQQKVHRFDSSWQERLNMVNVRITQWDSSTKRYRGSLRDRMEKKLDQVKKERDSLKSILDKTEGQAQEGWAGFQHSVSDQYATIVETLKELGSLNQ